MKYAICILAHKEPLLLMKIVKRLQSDNVEIFIHLDKKCNISDYKNVPGVTFINKREKVYWGGRSMVKAMYNLIEYVLLNSNCDYLLFISGEDYPIVLPKHYENYININYNYLEYEKLPRKSWYLDGLNRIKYYYLFRSPKSYLSKICIKIQEAFGIEKKISYLPYNIYGGSQWININRITAEYIIKNWRSYYNFFKFCLIPDEMIFQTIILNSILCETVINQNFRYLKYQKNGSNAAYITVDDVPEIIKRKPLFCRKVNKQIITEILNNIILNEG